MSVRVIVTLHLPLDMGSAGRIMSAVAREYPDAVINEECQILADDDPVLTKADRRKITAARRASVR